MKGTLSYKILQNHLADGEIKEGSDIGIRIDQTLTQDATGTMAYLQFESMGIKKVKTELSVSYVDHNTLQNDYLNADDHLYLQSVAKKYGILFSRAGNGICHQVHLERFAMPGKTLLGSDSHTPTAGGMGMIAIGAGGLDVAVAMGGGLFYLLSPKILGVELTGRGLSPWVSAKDVILELLRILTVKGGVGKIIEYKGSGVKSLWIPERATITNMGAELGATTSIFPADENTLDFLSRENRAHDFKPLSADLNAEYDESLIIDLSILEPLAAMPHSPDNVAKVRDLKGKRVNQIIVGSCTNSSYKDIGTVAKALKGKKIAQNVSFVVAPGSRQVLEMVARDGYLADIISAGARLIESACGPCIGMGQAPSTGGVSLRTFNRNFKGRSGTQDAEVYLVSPETAVASAITGEITDPRTLGESFSVRMPDKFISDDSMIVMPSQDPAGVEIIRGPNIKEAPKSDPLSNEMIGEVLLKMGDNITTDHIMPAGSKVLPFRSNIPKMSEFVFSSIDPTFPKRARERGGGFIVGGHNYGQGSSREHAALAPMYLKIRGVIVKSFARIHKANLINFGILPFVFQNEGDYDSLMVGDEITVSNMVGLLDSNDFVTDLQTKSGLKISVKLDVTSKRQREILKSGGMLNYTRDKSL